MVKLRIHRAVALFACLAVFVQVTACRPVEAGTNPNATAAGTPSGEQARAIILHALLLLNTQPNRMDNTTLAADGKPHQNVIETIPPDRKRIVGEGTEMVVAGGKVFLRTSDSQQWQEINIPASTYLGDMPSTEETLGKTVESGTFVRQDTLNGKPMSVFQYASTSVASGITLHSQTELWVGADGVPAQMLIDGETLSVSVDPSTGENKAAAVKAFSTVLITFDPSIKIEMPVP